MRVNLVYFKRNGKFYSEGEYDTSVKPLFEVWEEVREMRDRGRLPGLVDGADEFIVSVDVPEHPHNHPHLVMS